MEKIIRYAVMSVIGICIIPLRIYAATSELSTSPFTDHHLIAVPLSVKTSGLPLNALELSITYNPRELTYVSAQENTLLGTRWVDAPTGTDPGVVRVSLIVPGGFTNSFDPLTQSEVPAELGTVYFKQKTSIPTLLTIDATHAYYNTPNADNTSIVSVNKVVSLDSLPVKLIDRDPTSGPRILSVATVVTEHRLIGSLYTTYIQAFDGAGIVDMKEWNGTGWAVLANPFSRRSTIFDQQVTLRITNGLGVYTELPIRIPGLISDRHRDYALLLIAASLVGGFLLIRLRKQRKSIVY